MTDTNRVFDLDDFLVRANEYCGREKMTPLALSKRIFGVSRTLPAMLGDRKYTNKDGTPASPRFDTLLEADVRLKNLEDGGAA